jgi:hypothetical protein
MMMFGPASNLAAAWGRETAERIGPASFDHRLNVQTYLGEVVPNDLADNAGLLLGHIIRGHLLVLWGGPH